MVTLLRLAFLSLFFWSPPSPAATFTASADRKELYVNEHVLLTLDLRDSETRLRAEGVDPNVDLTVLASQFDLGVPRADFRFNIERNRGRASSTIAVELFPKRPGRLRIPSFAVEGLTTPAIELRVLPLPAGASPEVFARSGVAKRELFVGEQTLLFLDLYHRVNLGSAKFGGALDNQPRQVEAHALPAQDRTERVGGIEYQVTRTSWAISPLSDGPLSFFLPDIWIETAQGGRWRLPIREERLVVQPLPAAAGADTLVGRPLVRQVLSSKEGSAGQILPWEIHLTSTTALNLLPASLPVPPQVPGYKIYLDAAERRLEVTDDGSDVRSIATYRGYLMPMAAGELTTPTINLRYLDVRTRALAVASLPGQTVHIAPAPAEAAVSDGEKPNVLPHEPGVTALPWRLIAAVLGASWLATVALWMLRRRSPRRRQAGARSSGASARATPKERLLAAFASRTLEEGLRKWEEEHGVDADLRQAVRRVQRFYYRPGVEANEQALQEAVDGIVPRLTRPTGQAPTEDSWSPRAFHPSQAAVKDGETGNSAELQESNS